MEICAQSLYALVQEEHTEAPTPTTAQSKSAGTWMVCDDVTVCASSWEALSQSRRADACEAVYVLCYRKIGPGVGLEQNGSADEYKDLVEAVKKDGEQRALEREEREKKKEEREAAKKFTEPRSSQRLRKKDSEQLAKGNSAPKLAPPPEQPPKLMFTDTGDTHELAISAVVTVLHFRRLLHR